MFPDRKDNEMYNITSHGNMDFRVNSSTDPDTFYVVDMSVFKCSCPIGYNGHYCKHQGAVAKKYNIFTAINILSLSSKYILYEIALGKIANSSTFDTLKIDEVIANNSNQNIFSCNSSSIKIQHQQKLFYDNAKNDAMELDNRGDIDIETIKEKWTAHSNLIISKLENDPDSFGPAIMKYLNNCSQYAKSNQSLISGLYCAFKYTGISSKNKKQVVLRKGKKISVQPTSISRRKVTITGRRAALAGRKPGKSSRKQRKRAPHKLQLCVETNIGLGDNKFRK